ncbi:uroporphyrinogen-III C-methyltransferase [Cellulomonas shaoxiangyii]|uniref:uroporphyrinogen-III C-methyltransferase n=1 Tax=Cellulomonas shaoxiangyii TaxID=2566013 RepID=A0A4P7SI40_9CELL|nr:uroporphyrinogen-III C-methyltransferase [Cellulomonas shaoxiangyii]QCB93732.1 uroporphyrinogen-III C-methyltransferase [Cellulomonas shaoxiangyii]TGY81124.1 uroporphyrinogen-III C-methyltransferase [Cellulomonas shaoxiangyii]
MTALLGVELAGRTVVVAGGGPVAARRVHALLAEGAHVRVVAPAVCEPVADLVVAGAVHWVDREVVPSDLDDAWLVQTATGDRSTDQAVVAWATARRVFCVDAGGPRRPARGTARTPATTRAGDVLVGVVSTGGADPRRSVQVRDALATTLREGRVDLRGRRRTAGQGRVVLVGGGPGDVDLMTVAGRRALAEADVVVTDRLGPTAVLDELPDDVEVVDVGKAPGHHPVPQAEINRILVERAQRGHVVVRLKGGDPFVYGRGGEEVLACREAGVPVTVLPGVSSAFAAPAAAGIPLTHRGTVGAVHVMNGTDGWSAAALTGLRDGSCTVVVLMGVAALPGLAAHALADGVPPSTPVAVVEEATLVGQRVTRAPLDRVVRAAAEAGVRAPAVVVLGAVAAPGLLEPGPSASDGVGATPAGSSTHEPAPHATMVR